jgi:hypothetical protein
MCVVFPHSVNFNVLRVVYINKLFVDIGAIRTRVIQRRVEFA